MLCRYREQVNSGVRKKLLKFGVLGLGLLQDGDVGVGVFPEGKEILICGTGFDRVAVQWCKRDRVGDGHPSRRRPASRRCGSGKPFAQSVGSLEPLAGNVMPQSPTG